MVPLDLSARPSWRMARALFLGASALFLAGCGTSALQEGKLDRFEGELAGLRAENAALVERVQALEIRGAKVESRPASAGVDPRRGDRPALEVVHLVPDPPAAEEEVVHLEGAPPSAERDALAKAEFARGESLLSAKKYDAALNAFAGFVVRFPEHPRAGEATLRRGECYFHKGEHVRAAEHLEAALARTPDAEGAQKALALLADAYARSGDVAAAERTRARLAREPASPGARAAQAPAKKIDTREGSR